MDNAFSALRNEGIRADYTAMLHWIVNLYRPILIQKLGHDYEVPICLVEEILGKQDTEE